ncbi:MAG: phosphatase PAP2 family protein [Bacteriovoracaceae bacterium]
MNWALFFLFILSSCSLFTKKGDWGKNALWPIEGSRIKNALVKNATSPHVWAPAGSALIIHWGGYDNKISNWAVKESPVYNNTKNADKWSDDLNDVLKYEMFLTPLLTASSDEGTAGEWLVRKGKGYVVVGISSRVSDYAHDYLADQVARERPNHADRRSFPSGHATQAGTRNTITRNNLAATPMSRDLRTGINSANSVMAAGVLWARVEGQRHYPSDVLGGYAIGSFLSGVFYDSLINYEVDHPETFAVLPAKDKWTLMYTYAF